ncbi:hypothetical protein Q4993_002275 [Escherichia coli]|nr:hypothetical protein [Escherichia coli]EMA4168869.1 hypothetical protein [Escherichia coli]
MKRNDKILHHRGLN